MENLSSVVLSIAEDFTDLVVPNAEEEAAKAQLTRRIAFALHQVNPNIGLLKKTTGNQINGRNVDVVMDRTDGSSVDVATSVALEGQPDKRQVRPLWFPYKANPDPAWLERWIEPTEAIRDEPGPLPLRVQPHPEEGGEGGGDPGGGTPGDGEAAALLEIATLHHTELMAAIRENTQALQDIRRDIQNGTRILERVAVGEGLSDILGSVFSRREKTD